MTASFLPPKAHLETWRSLLLASLTVSAAQPVAAQSSPRSLSCWFPEYSLNVYANLIGRHLPHASEKPCLKTVDRSGHVVDYSYGEVDALVRTVAAALQLPPGGKVAVIGGPSIETATVMLASAYLGCQHTVVIPTLPSESIAARLALFSPDLIVVSPRYPISADTTAGMDRVATLSIAAQQVWVDDVRCLMQLPPGQPSASYGASDPLFTLFTSGSTGFPKGIVHGATGYLLFAHYTSHYFFGLDSASTMLCGASSGWINGHTYSLYAPLLHGATSVLVEDPARLSMLQPLHDILAATGPTILYLPVTTVRILRSISATSPPLELPVRLASIGTMGEMLAPSTEQWYSGFFSGGRLPVVNTYFQTETGGILCAKRFNDSPGIEAGEIGPLPWFASITAEHCILELQDSVPGFMIDILSPEHDTQLQKYFPSGCYCLHDYGSIENGSLFCSGRSDDVINVRGIRFASGEIESNALAIADFVECAAVEYCDALELTDMRLFVVLRDPARLADEAYGFQLLSRCTALLRHNVSEQASPGSIVFVSALPKTISGKILRRLLRYLELPANPVGMVLALPESMQITILGSV